MEQPGPLLERFIREYGDRAYRCAYRLCGDEEGAGELVQEAFRRVLEQWVRYDVRQSLEGWFFTILRHVFLDERRRSERRLLRPLDGAQALRDAEGPPLLERLADGEEGILERLGREEESRRVRGVLESLGREHREALTLCDMEGLSYEQIARVLGVPLGTVRSRVSRAREAFRARFRASAGVAPASAGAAPASAGAAPASAGAAPASAGGTHVS